MRRLLLCALSIFLAVGASAGTPHSLDRSGVLWTASSQPEGLVLTAQRDGAELVRTTVPFAVATEGAADKEISVAADELTGKVAVVWQRAWSQGVSEIMLGVWSSGAWERIVSLSPDLSSQARYPAVQLSRVRSTYPDPEAPNDATRAIAVEESFLHVVWWTGSGSSQHGSYGLLRLGAAADEADAITIRSLDELVWLGNGCAWPAPASVLERPLFASQPVGDRAYLFHGSRRACLFQLVEVGFTLEDVPAGPIVTAQRKRHTPVFGVRKLFAVPSSMSLDGARFVVGTDLNPVAYRVVDGKIEFISSSGVRWTPKRSVPVDGELTLDQAVPLVENLAR
jgi:hypothetical protein